MGSSAGMDSRYLKIVRAKISTIAGVKPFTGGAKHVQVPGILLTPLAVTKANLNVIVDKGWITKAEVCAGVDPAKTPYCK